jgi:poly-gamma-glutamate capsule biosynthesis protein CapA/YwtB (metallophosphatase superfamily)
MPVTRLRGQSRHYGRPKRRGRPGWLVLLMLAVVVAGGGLFGWQRLQSKPTKAVSGVRTHETQAPSPEPKDLHTNRIRLIAAGDFLPHDAVNRAAQKPDGSYDYLPLMKSFVSIFGAADVRFCNLSAVTGGAQFGISGYPKFNGPTEFSRDMGRLGCNLVNTGTNHSFDRNQAAINITLDTWAKVPNMLAVAGQNRSPEEQRQVRYFVIKGVKLAFIAYTTYVNTDAPVQDSYGVNVYSRKFAAQQIAAAKANGAQIIIASMRWGTEYLPAVTAYQISEARFLADQGVDLILGHGTHVLQPVTRVTGAGGNEALVWYGIGNFLTSQDAQEPMFNGLPIVDFDKTTLKITNVAFLPTYMHYEWTPAQKAASDLLSRHNLSMYLLDDATQAMIDAQQFKTTVAQQRQRLQTVLNTNFPVPMITARQYFQ